MTIAQILEKMIVFSAGNIHDIDHLIRVWTYARTIGELEGAGPRDTADPRDCRHHARYRLPALP